MFHFHTTRSPTDSSQEVFGQIVLPTDATDIILPHVATHHVFNIYTHLPNANSKISLNDSSTEAIVESLDAAPTATFDLAAPIGDISIVSPFASPVLRRFTRQHKAPSFSFLKEYHCNLLAHGVSPHGSFLHHIGNYVTYDGFSTSHCNFILHVATKYEPIFYHEAVKFPHWRKAMDDEIFAMERQIHGKWFLYHKGTML